MWCVCTCISPSGQFSLIDHRKQETTLRTSVRRFAKRARHTTTVNRSVQFPVLKTGLKGYRASSGLRRILFEDLISEDFSFSELSVDSSCEENVALYDSRLVCTAALGCGPIRCPWSCCLRRKALAHRGLRSAPMTQSPRGACLAGQPAFKPSSKSRGVFFFQ